MSELISGKEALNNWYDNIDTEIQYLGSMTWYDINNPEVTLEDFKDRSNKFRLKPRTITINNIEVPAPFEPKGGDEIYFLDDDDLNGYNSAYYSDQFSFYGYWRSEAEIKQVVAALRSVFNIIKL